MKMTLYIYNKVCRTSLYITLYALLSTLFVSCVDTVILPESKTVDEDMWQTKSDVQGVLATAYGQMKNEALMRNFIVWGDLRSDELTVNTTSSISNSSAYKTALSEIYALNILPSNTFASYLPLYSAINYCNMVIERAAQVVSIDPDYTNGDYEADRSKALALRSLCYFYLVRVFHDVPLELNAYWSSEQTKESKAQSAPSVVLQQCIDDLLVAEKGALNSNVYNDWRDKGYFTRDGIYSLLADIYLWRASITGSTADYQSAIDYCDKVIRNKKAAYEAKNSGKRGFIEKDYYLSELNNYYDDVWGHGYMNADESIFEIQFFSFKIDGNMVTIGSASNPGLFQMYCRYNASGSTNPPYLCTTADYGLVNAAGSSKNLFKNAEDIRQKEFVYGANTALDQYMVRKFVATSGYNSLLTPDTKTSSSRNTWIQNWIVYRLTDVMLMKAEALVQVGISSGDNAVKDSLNQIAFNLVKAVNDRALPENSASQLSYNTYRNNMESLVLMERGRELCFEGKRWFDLMRYNYRHLPNDAKADITKTFAEMGDTYLKNSEDFLSIAISKYNSSVMATKMPTEPYLYWPIYSSEMDNNPKLIQSPVWKETETSQRN